MAARVKSQSRAGRAMNGAGTGLVEDLDILRRRLARGQRADHGACARTRPGSCSSVFDGARAFEGVSPDLDLHCARVNASAKTMHLKPSVSAETWLGLTRDGIKRFAQGCRALHPPDVLGRAQRHRWRCRPIRIRRNGASRSTRRRCARRKASRSRCRLTAGRAWRRMPVDAKAGCLYPNNARALIEANSRGFDNCVVRDMLGNVAELATANLFIGKDGVVFTPSPNGTFLERHHPPARDQAAARRRRERGRDHAALCRLRELPTRSSRPAIIPR